MEAQSAVPLKIKLVSEYEDLSRIKLFNVFSETISLEPLFEKVEALIKPSLEVSLTDVKESSILRDATNRLIVELSSLPVSQMIERLIQFD